MEKIQKNLEDKQKNTLRVKKRLEEFQEEETARRENLESKRQKVKTNVLHTQSQLSKRSQSGFVQNINEAREMTQSRIERDRQHSARHYEALRHKLEEEEVIRKKGSIIRKQEDELVLKGLDAYNQKIMRGSSKAEMYKRETSSRASRSSI